MLIVQMFKKQPKTYVSGCFFGETVQKGSKYGKIGVSEHKVVESEWRT